MTSVNLRSEIGRLNAVLMHRPGPEIEAMTPENANAALYSDILNLDIVNKEYAYFSGALEKVTKVYYVADLLEELLGDDDIAERLVRMSCNFDGCDFLVDELLQHDPKTLTRELIEGFEYRKGKDPERFEKGRYMLKPLYNLFFTRDASSCLYRRALINSMSFDVRSRESIIYKAIFEQYFKAGTIWAQQADTQARTEGGDVQIVRDGLMCIGNGIRTNRRGIDYIVGQFDQWEDNFAFVVQELPHEPESFIHLDMVFTFLGTHNCMIYEPLLRKTGIFSNMHTYVISSAMGRRQTREYPNILEALKSQGVDLEPVFCGGSDAGNPYSEWNQQRDQWHSGANFFAFAPDHVIGYRRNRRTIEALDKAGYSILNAEDVCAEKVNPFDYGKAVVTFAASELPRGGGGARCMTCPVNREGVEWI